MKDWLVDLILNFLALLGLSLIVFGIGTIYLPAGIITAGLGLIGLAVAFARAYERNKRTR